MEFVESMSRSGNSSRMFRLTVTVISERSNWVSVPKPLAAQLLSLNVLPVVLQLRVLDGAGFPSKHLHHTHHVAWTGGTMSPPGHGGGGGALGIPSALAAALGLRAGTQVQVAPLLGVPAATVVEVEPEGESDWEVVEANAGYLEAQLMEQVGVLSRGQLFTVWARAGAAVRLCASATQPADLVRLVPGCELHVAPKPRDLGMGLPASQQPNRQGHGHGQGHGKGQGHGDAKGQGLQSTVVPLGQPAGWPAGGGYGGGVGGDYGNGGAAAWQGSWQQQHQGVGGGGRGGGGGGGGSAQRKSPFGTAGATGGYSNGVGGYSNGAAANGVGGSIPSGGGSNGLGGRAAAAASPFAQAAAGDVGQWGAPPATPGATAAAAATAAAGAVAAAAGGGLQARPWWAGALAGPLPGRVAPDTSAAVDVAAAVAAGNAAGSRAAVGGGAARKGRDVGGGDGAAGGLRADESQAGVATEVGRGAAGLPCERQQQEQQQQEGGATGAAVGSVPTPAAAAAGKDPDITETGGSASAAGGGGRPAGRDGPQRGLVDGGGRGDGGDGNTDGRPSTPEGQVVRYGPAATTARAATTPGTAEAAVAAVASAGGMGSAVSEPAAPSGRSPASPQGAAPAQRSAIQPPAAPEARLQYPPHHAQPPGQHGQQQLPCCRYPQPLRLRVLDTPPSRYLVPLPPLVQADGAIADGGGGGGSGGDRCRTVTATATVAATADPVVSTWLTLAVAVAPATAAALLGANGVEAPVAAVAYGSGALVRLHGRGTVRDLLGVLVPEPACPPGHVMLAPPQQHVLCVLPHMHVTVTALPPPPSPLVPPVDVAALPHLTLHPLPVPPLRNTAMAAGISGGGAAALRQAAEEVLQHQAALSTAAGTSPSVTIQPSALSYAVHRWLAAQMEGIRRAVLACTCDLRPARDGSAAADGDGPEILLPLVSGLVAHFRIHADGGSASAGPAAGGGADAAASPGPGDYSLIVHAVRRTGTAPSGGAAAGAPLHQQSPPVVSSRVLASLLAPCTTAMPAAAGAQAPAITSPPPGLSIKLGQPVVLPDVSYTSARHAAVLVARPLPPPLEGAAATALSPPQTQSKTQEENSSTTDAGGPAEVPATRVFAGVSGSPALGLDLDHISWLREELERCLRRVLPQLDSWVGAAVARTGLPRCGGVLVTGPPGSGRSQLLAALGDLAERHPEYQAHVVHVRCGQLAGGSHSSTTATLAALAGEALQCSPSLMLLDDLDAMCPSAAEGSEYGMQHPEGSAAASRLADWLSSLLDELSTATAAAEQQPEAAAGAGGGNGVPSSALPAVAVVAAAKDAAAVHATLRRVGRLDYEVRLPTPGSRGRAAMLAAAARQRGVAVDPGQLAEVAGAAEGFEGVDLRLLLDRAIHFALRRQLSQPAQRDPGAAAAAFAPAAAAAAADYPSAAVPGRPEAAAALPGAAAGAGAGAGAGAQGASNAAVSLAVTEGDLRAALEGFVPAAFWGVQQAAAAGGKAEGWEDVGGLVDVVSSLREALLLPVHYRDLVAAAPLRLRTGALLYGPPGCGKTHVVGAAVAAVSKVAPLRFLSVKGPELLNKYIGASEAAVRDLFARAAAAAPAVLFFDEFDAIAPPRGHDSTGVTDRVVNQLLTELDGVEGLRGVVVLAATSRPDLVDAALLRPGRLDRLLFCGPPEGPGQRLEILRALSRRLRLAADVDLTYIAEASRGLTGADLGALLSEAQLHAINEAVEEGEAAGRQHGGAGGGAGQSRDGIADAAAAAGGGRETATAVGGGGAGEGGAAAAGSAPVGAGAATDGAVGGGGGGGATPVAAASPGGPVICMRHLQRAMAAARPSLPAAEAARLAAVYDKFRQDRAAPVTVRPQADTERTSKRTTLA